MPAPTLVAYGETAWNTAGTSKNVAALSWLTGDLIVILTTVEDAVDSMSVANQLGLTFTHGGVIGTSGATCGADSWSATASSDQTSQQIAVTSSGASLHWGAAVWVFRNHSGIGNRATDITTAKTVNLTRAGGNSMVVGIQGDFSAAASTGYSFTPTVGNDRQHAQDSPHYTFYVADWGDQGASGTTAYGTTGETSTGTFAKIALEVKGTAAAAGLSFRPGKTWKRRYKHQQRLPVPPSAGVDIRSDTGLATVGFSADSTVKKVAVVAATSTLGLTATPIAKKVAPATGLGTVGFAANFVHVDIRPVTALATVGLTGTSTAKKVGQAALSAPVGLAGTSTAKKVSRPSASGTAGLTGIAAARKVAPATGRGVVGLQASFAHVEIHPISALAVLGLAATVTEKKRLTPTAVGILGLTANALPKKISKSTGVGVAGLEPLAIVGKKQGITGRLFFGLASWFDVPPDVPFGGILRVVDRLATSLGDADRAITRVRSGTRITADTAAADRRAAVLAAANRDTPTVGTGE